MSTQQALLQNPADSSSLQLENYHDNMEECEINCDYLVFGATYWR